MISNHTDEQTGKQIEYPFVSLSTIRIHISPTRYAWVGTRDLKFFQGGKTVGEMIDEKMDEVRGQLVEEEENGVVIDLRQV